MTIPRVLVAERMAPLHQLLLAARTFTGSLPVTGSRQPEDPATCAPGAHAFPDGRCHDLLLVPRAHNFFSRAYSRTFLASIASASIFFSSGFSFSSSLSRLASLTSKWPNCFRQRW